VLLVIVLFWRVVVVLVPERGRIVRIVLLRVLVIEPPLGVVAHGSSIVLFT
jgi:hypothetical protein